MSVHILGVCGTFMGGIALLAKESGVEVSGSDENVYPPMSTMLDAQEIKVLPGFKEEHLHHEIDKVVVGNVMTRGMPVIEYLLNNNIPYTSGPQWLYENILKDKWVLAVSGTHGKTTTASMLVWILEYAGLTPGFLIGGVPENFGVSARLGESSFFVVEADEYDTAFFDKRSKFVHYHPRTLIINNLEYDHADIFPDIDAIKTQFHHLVRIVPGEGLVVSNANDHNIQDVLEKGCWTPIQSFAGAHKLKNKYSDETPVWEVEYQSEDGSKFDVFLSGKQVGSVEWELIGQHNVSNALAAIAAAHHVGVPIKHAIDALGHFKGIKRRMEHKGDVKGISVYDDFAHHPTAIKTTLEGLRAKVGDKKIIAILEPRSNTMRLGIHKNTLAKSLQAADQVILFQPRNMDWDMQTIMDEIGDNARLYDDINDLVADVTRQATSGDQLLVMSNGGFGDIHNKLLTQLKNHDE